VIENQAQLIDIMPTIFDFLKINKPDDLQGRGLLPLLKNNVDVDPYTFSELKMNIFQRSIRTPKWQLIDKFDSFELYDLENDKKELVNVVDKFPDVKRDLENRLLLKFLNS
jgi:arylsulfatase A-like enzyme